jgi:hypothetical protein
MRNRAHANIGKAAAGEGIGWSREAPVAPEGARAMLLRNTRPRGQPNRRGFPHGAPPCRIYRPCRSVMQSGGCNRPAWVLEFEPASPPWIEPLMGWTASDDPFAQIRLTFPTLTAAVYRVIEPPVSRPRAASTQAMWGSSPQPPASVRRPDTHASSPMMQT